MKLHVTDTSFKYTHIQRSTVGDERRRCENSFGRCDNSEISMVCRNLDAKRKQRWEAQTRAADTKRLNLLLCTQRR